MTRDQFCKAVNEKRPYHYAIYERDTKKVLESGVTPAYGERVSVENWVGIQMHKHGGSARCCKRVKPDESHLFDGLRK